MLPLRLLVLLLTPAVVYVLISPSSTSCSTVLLPYLRWHLLLCALCISHISVIRTLWVLFCIFLVVLMCSLKISYAAWIHLGSIVMPELFTFEYGHHSGSVVRTPAFQQEGPGLVSDSWLGPLYVKFVCSPCVYGSPPQSRRKHVSWRWIGNSRCKPIQLFKPCVKQAPVQEVPRPYLTLNRICPFVAIKSPKTFDDKMFHFQRECHQHSRATLKHIKSSLSVILCTL